MRECQALGRKSTSDRESVAVHGVIAQSSQWASSMCIPCEESHRKFQVNRTNTRRDMSFQRQLLGFISIYYGGDCTGKSTTESWGGARAHDYEPVGQVFQKLGPGPRSGRCVHF